MATNGARGAEFERQCRKVLEDARYVVIRSAASKTGVDLVALFSVNYDHPDLRIAQAFRHGYLGTDGVLLVQCKLNGRMDPDEWNALYALAVASRSTPVLAQQERQGRRRVPAFYRITGPKVPRSRVRPLVRIEPAEVRLAEQ